ncbi:hypothetical protein [Tahibacter soli]|uniref:Uncharacterized protein n=1 Tax=Tahibacter soli TaxID=2983605 RepID=A0A9X3YLB9_9GAMM|nr:hypothetical protein [Tahibacter soli]MDC8014439.1 hypothetical protein [Tahibacter soli]
MSKIKSPEIKKRLSLMRDCRNAYGESPHGARKAIPKRQATRRRQERRIAAVLLSQVSGVAVADNLNAIENDVKAGMRAKRLNGFRKLPDMPLGEVVRRNLAWRKARRAFNA